MYPSTVAAQNASTYTIRLINPFSSRYYFSCISYETGGYMTDTIPLFRPFCALPTSSWHLNIEGMISWWQRKKIRY